MSDQAPQQEQWKPTVPGSDGARARGAVSKKTALALIIGIAVVATVAYGWLARASGEDSVDIVPTTMVKKGALTVSVTEGGTLHALEKLEIKSEVEGNNQILEIVPEGTVITEQDVVDQKVLVRLDAAGMEEKKASRDISYFSAEASKTQADKSLEIQRKQNESNEARARLDVKFARMELQKYLGEGLADRCIQDEGVDFDSLRRYASIEVQRILDPEDPGRAKEVLQDLFVDVTGEQGSPLGGSAAQELRDLSSDVQLAKQQLEQAEETLRWTEDLVKNNYINATELVKDKLDRDSRAVKVDAAEEALRLFVQYDLPKESEQRYSDLVEANSQLERVLAQNESEEAQAVANLKSKTATFDLEKSRKEKLDDMLAKSTIRATKPGLVVYATTSSGRWSSGDPIQEGTQIRENQTILTIPNLSTLAARVNVHETDIEKLGVGQRARITVEAITGSSLPAHVVRISPMANSENRWLNPDVIVYETDVALDVIPDGLSPGMSATAEIIIAELRDVLYVPLSAITTSRGQRVCWVKGAGGEPQLREVETGHFTDKFVEVRSGLREGETVYLAPPKELEEETLEERAEREQGAASPGSPEGPGERQAPEAPRAPLGPDGAQPVGEAAEPAAAPQADLDALRSEIQNLPEDQRRQRMRELMENLPAEQREQMMRRRGSRPGGRRPEGAPQGQGAPTNADR